MGFITVAAGFIQENAYIFFDAENGKAAIIDPGGDADKIAELLKNKNLTVSHILLTHGHYDHTGAVEELRRECLAPVLAHEAEEKLLLDPRQSYASAPLQLDKFLKDGDIIEVGGSKLRCIHTPGHTAGSCCFYAEDEGLLFSGDTLFLGSVGRHDLHTGNGDVLFASIKEKLYTLPGNIRVLPGHMSETTIEHEKTHNAFVR
ncbi:MAG: MBL fold metallo-hydrolase [Defluviitaleaceae bacterium]|nr:MBL fold metallo-hydrolase [Defluviitaleaceae bacterium]MCL2835696.1 MBL fold metallo-hydrolase [Defluviitaleaceae bacterium]